VTAESLRAWFLPAAEKAVTKAEADIILKTWVATKQFRYGGGRMKIKVLVVLLAILTGFTFSAVVFAQGQPTGFSATMTQEFQQKWGTAKTHPFEGTVVSHDVACHCFVIKSASGKATIIQDDYAKFEQEYDKAKGLKIGEKASGTYKTIDMINYATEVHQKM